MAAMELDWVPQSLYGASVSTISEYFAYWKEYVRVLPISLQFDVYYKLYQKNKLDELASEFRNLDVFGKMLTVVQKRLSLHHCFQAIRDHGEKISMLLAKNYARKVHNVLTIGQNQNLEQVISLGVNLATFLSDAGWNMDSALVFENCYQFCLTTNHFEDAFECCIRLLHVYNANCMYEKAAKQFRQAQELFIRLNKIKPHVVINLASLFVEYGAFHFAQSEYDKAYQWSVEALKMLSKPGHVSATTTIDVLRMTSKACVVKRQFRAAEHLVKHAVRLSKSVFGSQHPKYSSTLLDYGFYLLNVDNVCQSEKVYQTALTIRQSAFGGQNLHVAVAHEDLAYASYVHQYSTGRFDEAKAHADAALNILSHILPSDHLLLASSKRVKALILEEIAIDSADSLKSNLLLKESHDLHQQSLALSQKAFGERNVQTAKHYGNLGRLYQSMEQYKDAEQMHLKAIQIKQELLGPNDYEVALSVGHLASLYNYDLKEYDKAEKLYLRSIAIAKSLFGDSYSGLEYDYRGLIKLYNSKIDFEKVMEYNHILTEWNILREEQFAQLQDAFDGVGSADKCHNEDTSTAAVIEAFFRDSPPINTQIKPIPINVETKSRSSNDIAFGIGLSSQSQRSRNNDHRNVGDSSKSHSAISSLNHSTKNKNQSCSSISDKVKNLSMSGSDCDIEYVVNCDEEMAKSLLHYNVCPKSGCNASNPCSDCAKSM